MFLSQGSQYNVTKYTNAKNKLQGQLVKGQKANEREGKHGLLRLGRHVQEDRIRGEGKGGGRNGREVEMDT